MNSMKTIPLINYTWCSHQHEVKDIFFLVLIFWLIIENDSAAKEPHLRDANYLSSNHVSAILVRCSNL